MNTKQTYPAGGPREPVYRLMRHLGFKMSDWSDKHWTRKDCEVTIFGTGSMARITTDTGSTECPLDELDKHV